MTKRNPIVSALKDMIYFGFETFGRYYSTYRGLVANNVDPLQLQRVQLIIPELGSSNIYNYWASPKGVFSGPGYGMQVIPQNGDLVWVEFERGHPEVPIYTWGYFGNKEIPTDDSDLVDPNCYWFITPGGIRVKLNDTKKTITISANGAEIVLNPQGLFTIKNGTTDIKTLLTDMMTTYMQTQTISGDMIGPDSMQDAINNIQEINQLFT